MKKFGNTSSCCNPLRPEYAVYRCDWFPKFASVAAYMIDNPPVNPRSMDPPPDYFDVMRPCESWMDCRPVFCGFWVSGAGQSRRQHHEWTLIWRSPGLSVLSECLTDCAPDYIFIRTFYMHLDICTRCLAYSDPHDTCPTDTILVAW